MDRIPAGAGMARQAGRTRDPLLDADIHPEDPRLRPMPTKDRAPAEREVLDLAEVAAEATRQLAEAMRGYKEAVATREKAQAAERQAIAMLEDAQVGFDGVQDRVHHVATSDGLSWLPAQDRPKRAD